MFSKGDEKCLMKTQNTKKKHWMDGVGSKSQNVWFSWFDVNLPRAPASPRREPCCCHVHLLNRIILRCKIWDGCIIFLQLKFLSGRWIREEESECWYVLGNIMHNALHIDWNCWSDFNLRGERVQREVGGRWRSRMSLSTTTATNHPSSTSFQNIFTTTNHPWESSFSSFLLACAMLWVTNLLSG